jgi:L-ribulose-5-phosphate 4-epimerase
MLEEIKAEVCRLNLLLPSYNLVVWTSGNVSVRDPQTGHIVIKPSGVKFEDLEDDHMVVVDPDGNVVEGKYKASSDTASHLYIYRHMPQYNGVVHTHSRFATAFATHGRSIPCITTAMGDEFGGDIPCGGFALVGGEEIGTVVVETLKKSRSPACLLQNHGVFAMGESGEKAVKAAVMTEDNAAVAWTSLMLGAPLSISPSDIDSLYERYQHIYGQ